MLAPEGPTTEEEPFCPNSVAKRTVRPSN
ncbi:hypothetical protein CY0110_18452 [Crocosphaera chwakensis CCY0110]|uniref:Uncharacterized protein n=1 Tax=Crocosphaera chwakensis CCY0110 TaxID=391612 RepID=A3IJ22_9CHRO|nr:hypothetical protein CY0110_18452 [Crocosphaera chwakensis CCY0110]